MGTLTENELTILQDAFGRLLQDRCNEKQVREWMEKRQGFDDSLWRAIAEMGITGLLVDEKYGGTGAGTVAVERIMEQAGANLLGAPLLTSAVMSVAAIQASEDEESKVRLLPGIAAGSSIATLLITGEAGDWTEDHIGLRAKQSKDGWLLNGTASLVIHGRSADIWLAVANTDEGPTLFDLPSDTKGASCSPLPSFDHTMVLDQITLKDSPATQVGKIGAGWQSIEEALSNGLVALAGEQAGGAQKILDITVDYAKIRHQFGRPIGSFQAIKHMAANLLLEVESAISAARNAAAKTDEEADDAHAWRYLAGFACADAYGKTAADAIQMHGGIAFTWEHPAHLYLRRARATSQLLGSSDAYREKYLSAIGGNT